MFEKLIPTPQFEEIAEAQLPKNARRLIEIVRSQSLIIKPTYKDTEWYNMKNWCTEHFDKPRYQHPMWEAYHGWFDYYEGRWSSWVYDYSIPYIKDSFWFESQEDRLLFAIAWAEFLE